MNKFHSDELYKLEVYDRRGSGDREIFTDLLITSSDSRSKEIYLASISGSDSTVKDVVSLFKGGRKVGRFRRAEGNSFDDKHIRRNIMTHVRGNQYTDHNTRIGDITHTLLVSRAIDANTRERQDWENAQRQNNEGRMLPDELSEFIIAWDGDMETQIYKVLNDRYGTPLIEDWKGYIIDCLLDEGYYKPLNVYTFGEERNIAAGLLRVTEQQLENIISEGIKSYELDFAILEDPTQTDMLSRCETIDDYLTHFAGELGESIQRNIELRFDPKEDKHSPAFNDVNLHANENGLTGLFPPQADIVMGVANTLKEDDYSFVIGEMGSGKTLMGIVAPYITQAVRSKTGTVKPYRALVYSPSIMVEKWKREIEERVPNCEVYEITKWEDVLELKKQPYRPEKIEYYVMSSNLPMYTYPMSPIKDWRLGRSDAKAYLSQYKEEMHMNGETDLEKPRFRFERNDFGPDNNGEENLSPKVSKTAFHCPQCAGLLYERKDVASNERFFSQRSGRNWVDRIKQNNYKCTNIVPTNRLPKEQIVDPTQSEQECGFVLWQPEILPKESKRRKVSPAWAINKFLRRGFFEYLVADEVHQYKSGDSSVAQAFGQLINHTNKQILLTGTLLGGMASDIFYLLARLDPKRLLRESITYDDESLFTQRYGVFEKKFRNRDGRTRQVGSNKKPGISPHLFPLYLMRNCAFLELSDLGYALPPYEEIPVILEMEEEQKIEYKRFENQLGSIMRQNSSLGGMRYVSTYINTMAQYSDLPFNYPMISIFNDNGGRTNVGTPHSFNEEEFTPPKLRRMIQDIEQELDGEKKRKCLVYVQYTGDRSYNQVDTFLYDKLKSLGFNVGILKSSGSYDGIRMPRNSQAREEWLNDMMEKHDWDVLITNPQLVKVGLDLLQFPNIMYFQMGYSTYDYMQSSRRSWRIKQTEPVKVFTYAYRDTIQADVLEHVASKIDAAMAMQGKFSEEGLRSMADSNDGMHSLAKKLIDDGSLDNIETIHERFQRLNHSYEEMQSAKYEDYEHYEANPIEGGVEMVRKIALGLIDTMQKDISEGVGTVEDLENYMEKFEEIFKIVDDVKSYNKGVRKAERAIEGQVALDIF